MPRTVASLLLACYCALTAFIASAQPSWQWMGQARPAEQPALFSPGDVSTGHNERDIAISPDGRELYYSITGASQAVIVVRKYENGAWSQPTIAPFSGGSYDIEPAFSPDGYRLFFASRRSLSPGGPDKDFDIWYVEKTSGGWSAPINVGPPVNTDGNEFYPSLTNTGTLYYTARLGEEGKGGEDIVYSRYENGKYLRPVALDTAVNSERDEYNAFVDPNEQFIIFGSWQRPGAHGGGDLYISRKNTQGAWLPAENMGEKINSTRLDYCPFVSPDGKWLFFTSERLAEPNDVRFGPSLDTFLESLNAPGNGRGDIYWVRFDHGQR